MKTTHYQTTIGAYVKKVREGKIVLFPGQRSFVWNTSQQKALIQSILNGSGMPEILLGSTPTSKPQILDGQQRTKTLERFIYELSADRSPVLKTSPSDNKETSNKPFSKLPAHIQTMILSTVISVEHKEDCTDKELTELYVLRNNGSPLRKEEKRKAAVGCVNTFIYDERPPFMTAFNGFFSKRDLTNAKAQVISRILVAALVQAKEIAINKPLEELAWATLDERRVKYNLEKTAIPRKVLERLEKISKYFVLADNASGPGVDKVMRTSAGQVTWGLFLLDTVEKFEALRSDQLSFEAIQYIMDVVGAANSLEFPMRGGSNSGREGALRHNMMKDALEDFIAAI